MRSGQEGRAFLLRFIYTYGVVALLVSGPAVWAQLPSPGVELNKLLAEKTGKRFQLSFEFRALAPVYAGASFSVQARREADGSVTTWIADRNGGLAQQGRATFK